MITLKNIKTLLFVITLVATLITLFFRLKFIHIYDSEIGGIEIYPINLIHQLLNGIPMYNDPEAIPYRISQLTPLYFELTAFIGRLCHIDVSSPQQTYVLSRTFSLFNNILTIILFFIILKKRLHISYLFSFILSATMFMLLTEHYYSRSDSLYLLLNVSSILIFISIIQGKSNPLNIVVLSILVALTILTKQTAPFVTCFACTNLLIQKKYKHLFIFIISFSGFFFLLFTVLVGFDFSLFYKNNILGLKTGFDSYFYYSLFSYKGYLPLYAWFLIALGLCIKYLKREYTVESNLAFGILIYFCFVLLSGAQYGATYNHWTEFWIFTILLFGLYLNHKMKEETTVSVSLFIALTLLFGSTFFLKNYQLYASVYIRDIRKDKPEEYFAQQRVAEYIKNELKIEEGEYIYTTFRDYLDLFLIKNTVFIHKDMIEYLYYADTYRYENVPSEMASKKIKYLVERIGNASEYPLDTVFIKKNQWNKIATLESIYTIYEHK